MELKEIGKPLSLKELGSQNKKSSSEEEEVGFFESALAGVATGLWNIPKGFVSLGAELFDLIGDTNTAKSVEKWFDDVNPWDDEAEARTIGRITQALTQVGIPAVKGFQIGSQLATRALQAKQANKYMSMGKIGSKIMTPTAGGVIGGGIGEALVADEDIGTFADMARGTSLEPYALTMMDTEEKEGRDDAFRKLKNRIKFGTEGALFNLGIIGAGKGIKALRGAGDNVLDEYSKDAIKRDWETFGEFGLTAKGGGPRGTFESKEYFSGMQKAAAVQASAVVKELDTSLKNLGDEFYNQFLNTRKGSKETRSGQEIFKTQLQEIMSPASINSQRLLKPEVQKRIKTELDAVKEFKKLDEELVELGREINNGKEITEEAMSIKLLSTNEKLAKLKIKFPNIEELSKKITSQGAFTIDDYVKAGDESNVFKNILNKVERAGGDSSKLRNALVTARLSIDNMSSRLYLQKLDDPILKSISDNFGRYTNTMYQKYEEKGLWGFGNYKPTEEIIERSKEKYIQFRVDELQRAGRPIDTDTLLKEADDEVRNYAKKLANDEVTPYDNNIQDKSNVSKEELKNIRMSDKIIQPKILNAWQEELYGVIKDPSYTFFATVGKQANLNYTLDFLNNVAKQGSGPKGFVKSADELQDQILKSKYDFGLDFARGKRADLIRQGDRGVKDLVILDEQLQKTTAEAMSELSNPNKWKEYVNDTKIPNALDGKYIKAPTYDKVFDVTSNWLKSDIGTFYKYAVLAPKAGSQIAKTILSPLTHVRNLISAGSFVAANGAFFPNYGDIKMLLPKSLGGENVMKQAYALTGKKIFGTMSPEDLKLSERLLKVGVTDSNVQQGETRRLLRDILSDPASVERNLYNKLPGSLANKSKKGLLKAYSTLQDSYVAEDDFWKIINWSLERNRYSGVVKNLGINSNNILKILDRDPEAIKALGNNGEVIADYFIKKSPRIDYIKSGINEEGVMSNFLDEVAGNLTRNQVPNYAYIGRTGKALRQTPFGNFIAFPLEIMRTGHNIFQQSIDEITSGIPELVGLGYKRLFSFGATVGGVPYGMVEMFKAKNDVTDKELDALRKFVPEWSKNSTLVPTGRDEDGNLKYIDFSYMNAYDTLIRPFNSIITQLGEGVEDRETLMQSLGQGMIESTQELLKPYTTESIFTEALVDSTFRNGIGREGKPIWSDADETMVKIGKGILHVAESFTPGSLKQLGRLSDAARGKTDDYGQEYNVSDEIGSLWGGREIKSNPERSLIYMTTKFSKNLDKSNALFISPLLKGGRVSPEEILDRYQYSESRKFHTMKEMYSNIRAARTLGVPEYKIRSKVTRRGISKDDLNDLFQGVFTPNRPGDFFVKKMNEITRDLNEKEGVDINNPYYEALPSINELINKNRRISLEDGDLSFYRDGNKDMEIETQSITPIQPLKLPPDNVKVSGVIPQLSNSLQQQTNIAQRGSQIFGGPGEITFS